MIEKKRSKFPFEILLPRRRDTLKTYIEQNIAAASEFPQQAGKAKDFQDFSRMQMDAMKRFYEPDLNQSR